jgi:hypothetical protein
MYVLFSKGCRTSLCYDSEFNRTADVPYLQYLTPLSSGFRHPHFLLRLIPLIPRARGHLPLTSLTENLTVCSVVPRDRVDTV